MNAPTHASPLLVNVGCGRVYHRAWTNLDLVPSGPGVEACDISAGLPFSDGSCDAVYSSHVLEHLDEEQGRCFLRECARVLRHGGIIRIAVPDLERIASDYLAALRRAETPGQEFAHRWMLLELYDQTIRRRPGGKMLQTMQELDRSQREYVEVRLGEEASGRENPANGSAGGARPEWQRLRRKAARGYDLLLTYVVRVMGGSRRSEAFREGLFRRCGEVHLCMYDRVLLAGRMAEAGFEGARKQGADESAIPDFASYGLETRHGAIRKPDSLFMEAVRG